MDSPAITFNEKFRIRSKNFAISICRLMDSGSMAESERIIMRQLTRSGTSVASNFSAASRARSSAEYFSKLCIVVEEADECVFWLDLLLDIRQDKQETLQKIRSEALELLKVFATTKKSLKTKKK